MDDAKEPGLFTTIVVLAVLFVIGKQAIEFAEALLPKLKEMDDVKN
jgi:hypothetical protein